MGRGSENVSVLVAIGVVETGYRKNPRSIRRGEGRPGKLAELPEAFEREGIERSPSFHL
jgi:hypothetical protein